MVGLKSLSITAKLVVLMATAVVVPVVVGWYGLQDQNKLGAVAQEHVVLEQANSALNHLDTRESELKVSAHRGLVEPDVAAIEADLVEDGATINEIVAQLDALPLPAALRAEIVAVNPDVAAFTAFVGEFLRDARLHPAATLSREGEIDERNHVIDDKLGAIHEKLDAAGVQTRQREVAASAASDRGRVILALFLLAGLGVLVTLGVQVTRAITRPLRRIALVLASVSGQDPTRADTSPVDRDMRVGGEVTGEIGALGRAFDQMLDTLATQERQLSQAQISREVQIRAIHDQQRTADEQSRERVQSVINETTNNVVGELRAVVDQVNVVRNAAGTIDERVVTAGDAIHRLVAHAHEANVLVGTLGASLRRVDGIVQIITGVAAQTRLLSLNASIEAHRAGEAGRGFTVVAGEVKNLASSTAASTEEITSTIGTLERDARAMSGALAVIADRVTEIASTTSQVQEFTGQQQDTVEELDRRVTDMIIRIEGMSSVAASAERRAAPRIPVSLDAKLRSGNVVHSMTVINLSRGGLRCVLGDGAAPAMGTETTVDLHMDDGPLTLPAKVSSTTGNEIGLEFVGMSAADGMRLEHHLGVR
ncbi:MAG: methyl-accepting chemotaxis protein [Actinoplanes sp.]|jgi:methyl-accepting chemotaxis protein|nr:methyl-accepting chemotaxis protein [Actinoplanes sp.]